MGEKSERYYNPDEGLRMQRAEAYRNYVYDSKRSQCEMILQYLKWYASITPLEAQKGIGCMRLSARIADLRKRGYRITSEPNQDGKHYAIYRLEAMNGNV